MARPQVPNGPLSTVSEEELLALVFPVYETGDEEDEWVLLGPGDDTALLRTSDGLTLATTDTMVRGSDWLDYFSSAEQVGAKCVAQNVADIASMGGVTRGILVTLAADPDIPVAWAVDSARGIAKAAKAAGASVLGGDLSSAPEGTVMLSITALGDLQGRTPVRRNGARPGDVIALAGTLGRSGAGLELLLAGRRSDDRELVQVHLCPRPPIEQGPIAADAGATSMIDLSDGLVIDADRVARASGVVMAIDGDAITEDVARIAPALGADESLRCVLAGGEEHSLLATFPSRARVPDGWRVLGRVEPVEEDDVARVTFGGADPNVVTWDHFAR